MVHPSIFRDIAACRWPNRAGVDVGSAEARTSRGIQIEFVSENHRSFAKKKQVKMVNPKCCKQTARTGGFNMF